MNEQRPTQRTTYPLSLLFLIVTGAAVLAALLGPLVRSLDFQELRDDPLEIVGEFIGTAIAGMLLGAILGLFQFQRLLGVIVGLVVGGLLGPFAIIMTRVGVSQLIMVVPAMFIGCGILLLVAWFIRPPVTQVEEEPVLATLAEEPPRRTT